MNNTTSRSLRLSQRQAGRLSYVQAAAPATPIPATLFPATVILAVAATILGCSSSDDSTTGTVDPPAMEPEFRFALVSNGFGRQLPHTVLVDDGTGQVVTRELRTVGEIAALVDGATPVQPPVAFPTDAILPSGEPGNHYFLAEFTAPVDPELPCFSGCSGGGCIIDELGVFTFDPVSHERLEVPGRVFVGGYTKNASGELEQWVRVNPASGQLEALRSEAAGFPGVGSSSFAGAERLVAPEALVAVMDSDGDLSTFETFPAEESIQLVIPEALCSVGGQHIGVPLVASTSVGAGMQGPSIVREGSSSGMLPRDGFSDIDPETTIFIPFTEAVQPTDVGSLIGPALSPSVQVSQGDPAGTISTPSLLTAVPWSPFDLTRWTLVPSQAFFGLNPEGGISNPDFYEVVVAASTFALRDLVLQAGADEVTHQFLVGRGSSYTNAPVVPESLLIGRGGPRQGVSVIDLNGFGQGTGDPRFSMPVPLKGQSRFRFDPNFAVQQSQIFPPLQAGTTVIDGGSAGVFTLTLDSNGNSVLAGEPTMASASDAQYGASLDLVLRNSPPPFGCQAGGGDVCALDGLKSLSPFPSATLSPGFPNLVSFAPHPNPPKLAFPVLCVDPLIAAYEPSGVSSTAAQNLLLEGGSPFPDLATNTPPSGLLRSRAPSAAGAGPFFGPSFAATSVQNCQSYGVRQQIGQFLYLADRMRGEIVVLNSNRMLPIERIPTPDPTSLGLSPNLDVLAVANMGSDSVTLIDVDPASATFHQVLGEVAVGAMPRGIAFDPLDEDILVCNEADDTISIISALTLSLRKTVPSLVDGPFELAVTPRMDGFSFRRGVYFAYVIGRDGQMAVFESGPDGPGGFGTDSTLGVLPFQFQAPRDIVLDPLNLDASVYVAYEGPVDPDTGVAGSLGVGAVSRVRMMSALPGPQPLSGTSSQFRDIEFGIALTLSEETGQLSGVPASLAFDEMVNFSEARSPVSILSSGAPAAVNGKAPHRVDATGGVSVTNSAAYLFAAVPDELVVDVLQLGVTDTPRLDVCVYEDGVQSIPVTVPRFLTGYFSQ
ncbi:MAG: beta-propeller fold lactonase family protein [Planctomycetota bacterium]